MQYTHKAIWKMSFPIMLSLLAQNIINITDTAFLGRVGEVELGASALGGLWYLAIYMLGFGFSTGAQILISRRNGDKDYTKISAYFVQGTFFLIALAVAIIFLSRTFAADILQPVIKSPQVFRETIVFLDWRIIGLLFSFPIVMFRAFFVGVTDTKILTTSSIVMAVVNIFLDYVLIFGKFGFPELGIAGAAIASVIAECAAALYTLGYMMVKIDWAKYGFNLRSTYGFGQLGKVFDISLWTMIQYFVALGTWFIFFLATEHLGERSLAVSNIVRSLGSMLFMPVSAYGTTTNSLVSNMIGEGRIGEVPSLVFKIFKQCVMVVAPIMLLLLVFPSFFLQIYSSDTSLIHASVSSLVVLVASYLFATPGAVYFQFISGSGNTRTALLVECLTLAVYMTFVMSLVYFFTAPVWVYWLSEHIYWGMLAIFSVYYMKFGKWQNRKI